MKEFSPANCKKAAEVQAIITKGECCCAGLADNAALFVEMLHHTAVGNKDDPQCGVEASWHAKHSVRARSTRSGPPTINNLAVASSFLTIA
jgi:hypothetical protein